MYNLLLLVLFFFQLFLPLGQFSGLISNIFRYFHILGRFKFQRLWLRPRSHAAFHFAFLPVHYAAPRSLNVRINEPLNLREFFLCRHLHGSVRVQLVISLQYPVFVLLEIDAGFAPCVCKYIFHPRQFRPRRRRVRENFHLWNVHFTPDVLVVAV
ncbi:Uncharacterised protein [uncultured archaeon]|nr:Uncharacterised protein [uncultured archaeon]